MHVYLLIKNDCSMRRTDIKKDLNTVIIVFCVKSRTIYIYITNIKEYTYIFGLYLRTYTYIHVDMHRL